MVKQVEIQKATRELQPSTRISKNSTAKIAKRAGDFIKNKMATMTLKQLGKTKRTIDKSSIVIRRDIPPMHPYVQGRLINNRDSQLSLADTATLCVTEEDPKLGSPTCDKTVLVCRSPILDQECSEPSPVEFSSSWRGTLSAEDLEFLDMAPDEIKYQELIHELIVTEQAYVDDLEMVQYVRKKSS